MASQQRRLQYSKCYPVLQNTHNYLYLLAFERSYGKKFWNAVLQAELLLKLCILYGRWKTKTWTLATPPCWLSSDIHHCDRLYMYVNVAYYKINSRSDPSRRDPESARNTENRLRRRRERDPGVPQNQRVERLGKRRERGVESGAQLTQPKKGRSYIPR